MGVHQERYHLNRGWGGALLGEQMAFGEGKWVLRRLDRRHDSSRQCVSEKTRLASHLGRVFRTIEFFGEVLLLGK